VKQVESRVRHLRFPTGGLSGARAAAGVGALPTVGVSHRRRRWVAVAVPAPGVDHGGGHPEGRALAGAAGAVEHRGPVLFNRL
jgi:hypothetical protein